MPTLEDFECDFDRAVAALAAEMQAEIEAVPPEKREAYLVAQSAARLARCIELDAPAILLLDIRKTLLRRLGKWTPRRLLGRGEVDEE